MDTFILTKDFEVVKQGKCQDYTQASVWEILMAKPIMGNLCDTREVRC